MSTADGGARRPVEVGYWLSSEEHGPRRLVELARLAEDHGFDHAMISDHFHPWTAAQGHAPFVWGVLGAIGQATERLQLATGVTAPIARLHPAIVAQAAATAALLLDGRFVLGLGTGERLNEHIVGGPWPRPGIRRRTLAESVEVIRRLLDGDEVSFEGEHVTVEHAQLFSRPVTPPPIWIAASGRRSAQLAGRAGDGMVCLAPEPDLLGAFETAGGAGKPVVVQLHFCWAPTREEARATAHRVWPNAALPPALVAELSRPAQFAEAAELVSEDAVAQAVVCGPDPEAMARSVLRCAAVGASRVYVHQVGPDQEGFAAFWAREVRPLLRAGARG
jgi:G6PDH family F420-dependent oxidoreductase